MFTRAQVMRGAVTVVIAPILAIAFQKTAEYATTPKSDLTYYTISGPSFTTETNNKGLYALTVRNNGSTRLTNVTATMEFPRGAAIEVASKRALSTATIKSGQSTASFTVPVLFPGEQEWVSVFASGGTADALRPQYSARSNEANGRLDYGDNSSSRQRYLFLYGALGALIGSIFAFGSGLHRPSGIGTTFAALTVASRVKVRDIESIINSSHQNKLDLPTLAQALSNEIDRAGPPEKIERYADFIRGLMIYPSMSRSDRMVLKELAKKLGATAEDIGKVQRSYWAVRNKMDLAAEIDRRITSRDTWI